MRFDNIIDFLEEFGIEFWTSGSKNVSPGWIGLQCPFPECDDDTNHLGIRLKDKKCNCWKCGPHSLRSVIKELTDLPNDEIKSIIKFLGAADEDIPPYYHQQTPSSEVNKIRRKMSLPQESSIHFPQLHLDYLRSRGFPPLKTIRKYKLRATRNLGKYKFRIIIPVYMDRKLVNFTSRDVTGEQEEKYRHAPNKDVILHRDHCVYNIDSINQNGDAILCEGPLDVMKMGDGAVSFFGVQENVQQIIALKNKKIRNLYIMFDNDKAGNKNANRIAKMFAPLFKKVEVIKLNGVEDPGQLTLEEAATIKHKLLFNL